MVQQAQNHYALKKLMQILFSIGLISMWLIGYRVGGPGGLFLGDTIALALLPICMGIIWFTEDFDSLVPEAPPIWFSIGTLALVAHWATLPHFDARRFLLDVAQFSFYFYFAWLSVKHGKTQAVLPTVLAICFALASFQIFWILQYRTNVYMEATKVIASLWLSDLNVASNSGNSILATALFQNRNQFAMFSAALFAYVLFNTRWFFCILAIILVVASGSRTGMAMAVLLIVAFSIYSSICNRRYLIVVAVGAALFTYFTIEHASFIVNKFQRLLDWQTDSSTRERIQIYNRAWDSFKHQPLFGTGFGQLKSATGLDNIENSWARFVLEFGLIPVTTFTTITFILLKNTVRKTFTPYIIAFIALAIMGIAQPFLWQSQIAPLFVYLILNIISNWKLSSQDDQQ